MSILDIPKSNGNGALANYMQRYWPLEVYKYLVPLEISKYLVWRCLPDSVIHAALAHFTDVPWPLWLN